MSQPSSNKGKDPSGKKFASLNVNQTFKGTKVESRTAAGGSLGRFRMSQNLLVHQVTSFQFILAINGERTMKDSVSSLSLSYYCEASFLSLC